MSILAVKYLKIENIFFNVYNILKHLGNGKNIQNENSNGYE